MVWLPSVASTGLGEVEVQTAVTCLMCTQISVASPHPASYGEVSLFFYSSYYIYSSLDILTKL